MQTKFTIAMVVMLMAAAFAGVVAMDDESDAAVSYTISVDKADSSLSIEGLEEVSNKALKNDVAVIDGKITGTVTKAPKDAVTGLWGNGATEEYILVFTIGGLVEGTKIIWIPSNVDLKDVGSDFNEFKGVVADGNGEVTLTMRLSSSVAPSFEFIITAASTITVASGTGAVSGLTYDAYQGYNIEKIGFNLAFIGNEVKVEYTVGELTYIQKTNEGLTYALVALDALRAEIPEGKAFTGWYDEVSKNTYPVGTVFVIPDEKEKMSFTAVFEDITPVVTFAVNGEVIPELTKTIKYGEKIVAPEVPEGCTGWNFDFTQAIFADVQIDAVLEEVPEVQVTFFDGITYYGPVKVSEIKDKVPTVTKDGHNFVGWFIDGVKVDPLAYEFTEDTTLVAGWDPIKCKVVFMVGGAIYKEQTVEYGKTATEAVLPEGYSAWDFDFATPVTEDLTVITAIEKAPEKPTGLADPTVKMALVIVGLFVCVLLAVIILKREDIRAGMVRKLSKAEDVKEDKKE